MSFPLVAATFYTFSCFLYITVSRYQRPFSLDTSVSGAASFVFNIDISGNNQLYAFANYPSTNAFTTGPVLNVGTWYHLAVTWNTSTKTINLFVNGITYGSSLTGVGTLPATNVVKVGTLFSGYIRNFRVYNSILSASQIQDIYTQPTFTPASIPGLQMWLDGADPNGSGVAPAVGTVIGTWADKSGNGFNGTGVASPTYVAGGGISFNGSTQGFTTAYTSAPLTETVFAVARTTITTNPVIIGSSVTGGRSVELGSLMYVNRQSVANTLTGTTPVILNTPYLYDYTYVSGGNATGFRNGSQDSTNGSSPAFTTGGTTNIGVRINNGYWNGTILEVIIFNRVLTTAQRQQIEAYLAWKWGIPADLPGAHPNYSAPLTLTKQTFNPTQISGLQIWLDGLDPLGSGILPRRGTVISTWVDKSGNSRNGTSVNSSTYVAGGGISLNGVNQYYTTTYSAAPTTETLFIVFSFPGAGSYPIVGNNGVSGSRGLLLGSATQLQGYGGFAIINTATSYPTNTVSLYNYTYVAGGTTIDYKNGTQTTTATGSYALNGAGVTFLGYWPFQSTYVNCTIYDFIIYNRVLTVSERQQVEGYLAAKWSLQSSLPGGHPYTSALPTAVAPYRGAALFNPTSYSGLQMWLDGKDPLNTGTAPSVGAAVTTWADKSGNGRNGTAVNNPTFITGGGMSFNGTSQYYTTTYTAAPATETAFVLFSSTNPSAATNKTPIGNNNINGSRSIVLYINKLYFQLTNVINPLGPTNANIDANTVYMYNYIYTAGGLATAFVNGSQDGTNNTATASSGSGVTYIANNGGGYFAGSILEVVIYNRILTTTERQTVEGYLAWKWRGSISLPGAHPYVSGPPTLGNYFNNPAFSPGLYPGLQMWLDGQDPFNTGTPPNPGAAITTWVDKSGKGFSGTGLVNPTYVAGGGISFNGTNQAYNTTYTLGPTTETVFFIFRINSVSATNVLLGHNTGNTGNRAVIVTTAGNIQFEGWGGNNIFASTGPTPIAINTTYMFSYTYTANGNTIGFLNGSQYFINTLSYALTGAGGTVIGYWPYLNAFFNGTMSEIIIYNTVLTTSQRQNVEGYLAWKWGLQGSLPSTHPFKLADPSSSVPPAFTALTNLSSYASTYLPLETNAIDIGTSPKTVTTNGTVFYTTILGKACISFNNSISNYLSFPMINSYGMTIAFWFNYNTTGTYFTMASFTTAAYIPSIQFDLTPTTNLMYTALPTQWTMSPSANNSGINTWNFITITINQSTFVQNVYMNGSFASTATGSGAFSLSPNLFLIGKSGDNGRGYQGYIHRFMFFNTVLSATQVNTLYKETNV